jgi:hypothetical protein
MALGDEIGAVHGRGALRIGQRAGIAVQNEEEIVRAEQPRLQRGVDTAPQPSELVGPVDSCRRIGGSYVWTLCRLPVVGGKFLMLVANQGSSNIVVFHVDEATGALRPTGRVTEVPEPTCVGIAASPGP